jgi:hypothetical protein
MKKYTLPLICLLFAAQALHAQITSPTGAFASEGTNDLTLNTGTTTTRLTILSTSGFVGLGITPTERLHVNGNILSSGNIFSSANISASGASSAAQYTAASGNFGATGGSNLSLLTGGIGRLSILNANGFVGIGTTPSEMLHVNGNVLSNGFFSSNGVFNSNSTALALQTGGTSRLTVLGSNGNVGIGTAAPEQKLHITGDLLLDNGDTPTIYTGTGTYLYLSTSGGQPSVLKTGGVLVADSYNYASPSRNDLVVKGKVAIGTPVTTSANGYTLAVNGKIGAKDVQIERNSNAWPDYVFAPAYELPSLSEVEQYVRQHHHLSEVPSAKEVEEKGHSVGDMDLILLKKVEELTLYIIEQQKQIDALKKKLEEKK